MKPICLFGIKFASGLIMSKKNGVQYSVQTKAGLIIAVWHRTLSDDGMILSDEPSKLPDIVSDEKQFSL